MSNRSRIRIYERAHFPNLADSFFLRAKKEDHVRGPLKTNSPCFYWQFLHNLNSITDHRPAVFCCPFFAKTTPDLKRGENPQKGELEYFLGRRRSKWFRRFFWLRYPYDDNSSCLMVIAIQRRWWRVQKNQNLFRVSIKMLWRISDLFWRLLLFLFRDLREGSVDNRNTVDGPREGILGIQFRVSIS